MQGGWSGVAVLMTVLCVSRLCHPPDGQGCSVKLELKFRGLGQYEHVWCQDPTPSGMGKEGLKQGLKEDRGRATPSWVRTQSGRGRGRKSCQELEGPKPGHRHLMTEMFACDPR